MKPMNAKKTLTGSRENSSKRDFMIWFLSTREKNET